MNSCRVERRGKPLGKVSAPIIGLDGDIQVVESDFSQDFRFLNREEVLRGIFYAERRNSFIYLGRFEHLHDIYSVCKHEAKHGAFDNPLTGQETLSIDEEHIAMFYMEWAEEFLVHDKDPRYNKALRDDLDKD